MKYAAIRSYEGTFEVRLMCRALGVSRSGYYAWRKRGRSARAEADARLRVDIRAAHERGRRTYGSPRVHRELRAAGIRCGKKRIERLMREDGLRARRPRRFRTTTTDSRHPFPTAPNRLERRFGVQEIQELDRVWAGDITYVPTREGWLYLAVVLDLASRRVVGWAMRDTLEAVLAIDALEMALQSRRPSAGLLHHSDRGVQYACHAYRELLEAEGIQVSMSRTGDCWDNAVVESFFSTLEWELIGESHWRTRAEARTALFDYIECFYNRQRRHSSLGYLSPAAYEERLALTRRAA